MHIHALKIEIEKKLSQKDIGITSFRLGDSQLFNQQFQIKRFIPPGDIEDV